jgi:hypothetical protein
VARYVQVVHELPGRIRLRAGPLRREEEAEPAARALAALHGVAEVRAHPFTGSFLVRYDDARLDGAAVADALAAAIGGATVLPRGAPSPVPPAGTGLTSAVGRALVQLYREVNAELLRRTGGGLDLPVVATAAFLGMGAAEVVARRKIAAPPWFNLAWWSLQTLRWGEGMPGATPEPSAEE